VAVVLYRFKYRNPRTRKWVTARSRAELHVIEQMHEHFVLIGEPQRRDESPEATSLDRSDD
jgi:hypothetical protein